MDDEPQVEQLENRIDKLESTIEKMMPSRRDALKMGGAALAGGSLMAGTASAGTNQVGTIGSASQPVDIESEDINNADTVTTQDLVVSPIADISDNDISNPINETITYAQSVKRLELIFKIKEHSTPNLVTLEFSGTPAGDYHYLKQSGTSFIDERNENEIELSDIGGQTSSRAVGIYNIFDGNHDVVIIGQSRNRFPQSQTYSASAFQGSHSGSLTIKTTDNATGEITLRDASGY